MNKLKKLWKNSSKTKKIFIIITLLILFGIASFVNALYKAYRDIPEVEQKLDTFMTYMTNEEYEDAYILFSDSTKESLKYEEFEKQARYYKPQYSTYKSNSLEMVGFMVNKYAGHPSTFKYQGKFKYTDGDEGFLTATFLLIDDEWDLFAIDVRSDINRLDGYTPPEELE